MREVVLTLEGTFLAAPVRQGEELREASEQINLESRNGVVLGCGQGGGERHVGAHPGIRQSSPTAMCLL